MPVLTRFASAPAVGGGLGSGILRSTQLSANDVGLKYTGCSSLELIRKNGILNAFYCFGQVFSVSSPVTPCLRCDAEKQAKASDCHWAIFSKLYDHRTSWDIECFALKEGIFLYMLCILNETIPKLFRLFDLARSPRWVRQGFFEVFHRIACSLANTSMAWKRRVRKGAHSRSKQFNLLFCGQNYLWPSDSISY